MDDGDNGDNDGRGQTGTNGENGDNQRGRLMDNGDMVNQLFPSNKMV